MPDREFVLTVVADPADGKLKVGNIDCVTFTTTEADLTKKQAEQLAIHL